MDEKQLAEYLDQHRWLLNSGLISDGVKNQLFMYGSIVHKQVQAVELSIVPEERKVSYKIFVDENLVKKIQNYHAWSRSDRLWDMWRLKRLLKKEGVLDFRAILSKFVNDFCGPAWSTEVEVLDFAKYVDGFGDESGTADTNWAADKPSNN